MNRFDRVTIAFILTLTAVIAVVVLLGDHAGIGIDVSPRDGDRPSANTSIRIEFNQPMDFASVESRFSIEPKVDGTISWEGNTLVFKPRVPLSAGQTYTAQLQAGAASKTGRQTSELLGWTFKLRPLSILYLTRSNTQTDALWRSDSDGANAQQVYSTPYGLDSYAVSPDGGHIALSVLDKGADADVWLLDPSGQNLAKVTSCSPGYCSEPVWLPDGTGVVYIMHDKASGGADSPGRIWVYDMASRQSSTLFQDEAIRTNKVIWSPEGSHLAFFDLSEPGLRILDINSGQGLVIPGQMGEVGSFSPDGTALAYSEFRQLGGQFYPEVWIAWLDSQHGIAPLADLPEEDRYPKWSPDNQWIAFSRRLLNRTQGFAFQFMLYNVQNHVVRQVTHGDNFNDVDYEWSPTGDAVIVQRQQMDATPPSPQLWLYTLKTGQMKRIVSDGLDPQWLP